MVFNRSKSSLLTTVPIKESFMFFTYDLTLLIVSRSGSIDIKISFISISV